MKNYFNTQDNIDLWTVLQKKSLESLLDKAKELEKKYEWRQAATCYKKTSDLIITEKNILKKADYLEKEGHCHFKAAYQANSNKDFVKELEKSIEVYHEVMRFFKNSTAESLIARSFNAEAKIAYARFWIEIDALKKRELIEKWWAQKNNVLKIYHQSGDKLALVKTYNDILENSTNCKYWFGMNWEEAKKIRDELISCGEKAITILTEEIEDSFELARAYCWTSWYYTMSNSIYIVGDKTEEIQKGLDYSRKALEISKKIGDKWLISWSYNSAAFAANLADDLNSSINFLKCQIEQGRITRDHYLLGFGKTFLVMTSSLKARLEEDPEKKRKLIQKNIEAALEIINHFQLINLITWNPYYTATLAFRTSSDIEPDAKLKYDLLVKSVEYARKAIRLTEGWKHSGVPAVLGNSISALFLFSIIEKDLMKKRKLLEEVLGNSERWIKILEAYPYNYFSRTGSLGQRIFALANLAEISSDKNYKINLLTDAVSSIKIWLNLAKKTKEKPTQEWMKLYHGQDYYRFGKIFHNLFLLTNEKNLLLMAIKMYEDAITVFNKLDLKTQEAESFWQKAIINDQLGLQIEAAKDYNSASATYSEVTKKIPQLKDFYMEYSLYMQAWSQIEEARYSHSIEEYDQAKNNYEMAAKLHESTERWSYLSSNYFAWSNMEEAEKLSRRESTQQAKEAFKKTLKAFIKAENSIGKKIGEIASPEEKELTNRLLEASDLRRRFCQARIQIEEAKLLDREGKYPQSSRSYRDAAQKLGSIIEKIGVEAERKEMEYLAILCRAWEKMAVAEETTSSEVYLEATELFEQAKEYCYTKKASLWALGDSSFCKGLAAGLRYRSSMDLKENALAKRYVKDAASCYFEAGFTNASEYAKATLRLFDAYIFMNQAECEVDPEKKTKQYQLAENLLQIAAGSFMKAKQPEKTAQVQRILINVREEKALAVSLGQVMQAPTIASSTLSFTAPSPTSEVSVGLEQFQHANIQANLIAGLTEIKVGESFCLSVEFVNAGKEPALLTRVEDFILPGFFVVKQPEIYRLEGSCLNMKGKQIGPLKLVEAKLVLQPSKKGVYQLKPVVHYMDELGQNRSLQLKSVEIRVEEVVLADRVSTGTKELDSLLLGGIPREYAVVLTGPPSDEREFLVRNFLEAGAKEGQTSFYVATEAVGLEELLEKSGVYLFLCNPKPKVEVPDLPNIHKLLGKTDLTNLNIALLKAYRSVESSSSKRVCLEIVSDVLLRYGAEATRRWISELTTDLVSKGFTVLAVLNPGMHPPDQATAVVDLFDGEICITQTEDPLECRKSLRVRKLRNQDYIKNPICLRS